MKLVNALFSHAWLAIRLKHDGSGLPANISGAFMLVALYIVLILINKNNGSEVNLESLMALSFIAQFYVFCLRNKVIGLIILIGIIINALSLVLAIFGDISEGQRLLLFIAEAIMIFAALINIIKSNAKVI
jgi:hypothetical protein